MPPRRGRRENLADRRLVHFLDVRSQGNWGRISCMSKPSHNVPHLLPRLRVLAEGQIALGPGKVRLLALIHETGSIRQAAERMEMSYMRAWKLIQTMNACFRLPVVEASRGGRDQGGATLSPAGLRALELYVDMEQRCLQACQDPWAELATLLTPRKPEVKPARDASKRRAKQG